MFTEILLNHYKLNGHLHTYISRLRLTKEAEGRFCGQYNESHLLSNFSIMCNSKALHQGVHKNEERAYLL